MPIAYFSSSKRDGQEETCFNDFAAVVRKPDVIFATRRRSRACRYRTIAASDAILPLVVAPLWRLVVRDGTGAPPLPEKLKIATKAGRNFRR